VFLSWALGERLRLYTHGRGTLYCHSSFSRWGFCGVSRGYLGFLDHEGLSGIDLPWDAEVLDVVESAGGEVVQADLASCPVASRPGAQGRPRPEHRKRRASRNDTAASETRRVPGSADPGRPRTWNFRLPLSFGCTGQILEMQEVMTNGSKSNKDPETG
jgi:hypothetical protein